MYLSRPLDRSAFESISFNRLKVEKINFHWQVNNDYTMIYFVQGNGRRFVGDSTSDFHAGDFIIIPPNMPFALISDYEYVNGGCEFIWMRFDPNFAGKKFFSIPEMSLISGLLKKSDCGLLLENLPQDLTEVLVAMEKMTRMTKFLTFLTTLDSLANLSSSLMCTASYQPYTSQDDMERINEVCGYINMHYQKNLSAEQLGELIHMSAPSFCRFFKRVMNKTFHRYLCEIRINLASRLLCKTDLMTEDVGKRCGFRTIPGFTARFKDLTGHTPAAFRKSSKAAVC
ncbi:MAG: AraC family transcriptional regulator [Lentisphaeraceae bacterium]|nr:AraC family transcriptional regulator [Lentisphaeraceae bacterium]